MACSEAPRDGGTPRARKSLISVCKNTQKSQVLSRMVHKRVKGWTWGGPYSYIKLRLVSRNHVAVHIISLACAQYGRQISSVIHLFVTPQGVYLFFKACITSQQHKFGADSLVQSANQESSARLFFGGFQITVFCDYPAFLPRGNFCKFSQLRFPLSFESSYRLVYFCET